MPSKAVVRRDSVPRYLQIQASIEIGEQVFYLQQNHRKVKTTWIDLDNTGWHQFCSTCSFKLDLI